ncbi:hypothetical protein HPB50_011466 [Hyalomma asiaticum]|uniref:Uncharacterized protein n=1 Tax=Hyalomma asiaticum TaxID=266040 RepID=A0ACB7TIX6_HYAAI|nr:hypothetical protein HPB50_011466 [Hyalomma asiaticum]
MCGFLKPSLGQARRICRILCSEWWRQVRFFHDCLVVACSTETTYRQQGSLQEWRATTKRVTEFLWNVVRTTLPTKKKKGRPQGDIRTLGDCSVPENVWNVLCLGPKFAFEPKVPPAERVALSRSISRFVPEAEQARNGPNSIKFLLHKDPPKKKPMQGPIICRVQAESATAISLFWEYSDLDAVDVEGFYIYLQADTECW